MIVLIVVVSQGTDSPNDDDDAPAVAETGKNNDVATPQTPGETKPPAESVEQRPGTDPTGSSPFEEVEKEPAKDPEAPIRPDQVDPVAPMPSGDPAESEPSDVSPRKLAAEWKRRPLDGLIDWNAVEATFLVHPSFRPEKEITEALPRRAVPSATEIERAQDLVREVYAADILAAQSPAERIALAADMYAEAAKEEEAGEGSYALLRAASLLAVQAGEIATSLTVVDSMANVFEIDSLRVKANIVIQESENADSNASGVSIAGAALALIDPALMSVNYELAEQLRLVGLAAAEKSRNAALTRIATSIEKELSRLKNQSTEYESALAALGDAPDDPQANLVVGKYYCFVMGDWQYGLPFLLRGGDEALAAAAKLDLAGPIDETERAAIGDAWWDFADSPEGFARAAIRARAVYWYELAAPVLTGLTQARVERRIQQFRELAEPESAGGDDLSKDFAGEYYLVETNRKTKQQRESVLDFQADFQVSENGEVIGRWEVDDGNRIKLTMLADPDEPLYLKPRTSSPGTIATRTSQGNTWQIARLTVVSVWEHKTEAIRVFGRRIREEFETLTFYSNGRVNEPLGGIRWSINRQNLVIDWGKSKQTVAILASGQKAYAGKTTARTGFANTTITRPVVGRLVDAGQ